MRWVGKSEMESQFFIEASCDGASGGYEIIQVCFVESSLPKVRKEREEIGNDSKQDICCSFLPSDTNL